MACFDEKMFPNLLDSFKSTSAEIETQLKNYSLYFFQERDPIAENSRFPGFAHTFYEMLKTTGKIPTQEDFWQEYRESNKFCHQVINLSQPQTTGLKARVFRAYPSLVRDIHFAAYIRDSNAFNLVLYNEILDIEHGIDLVIGKNNNLYAVSLFTDTAIARSRRNDKKGRHSKQAWMESLIPFDLPIELGRSKKAGEFFLYSEPELSMLKCVISTIGANPKE